MPCAFFSPLTPGRTTFAQRKLSSQICPRYAHTRVVTRSQPGINRINDSPTCVWVERSASVIVEMAPTECFDYYKDLETMPEWSPWLRSVEIDKDDSDVSRWTLAARGLQVSWKARNTKVVRGEIIAWKSETGLPNRGRVLFESQGGEKCRVTLAIEFDVPSAVARAFDNDFVGRYVESTLGEDLKRFRSVALLNKRRRLRTALNSSTSLPPRQTNSS